MSIKPVQLWGHWGAPNPWKVATVLDALRVPYDVKYQELNETKTESFLKITPNGRMPAIEDPNTGITLWEVGWRDEIGLIATLPWALLPWHTVRRHHPVPRRPI